MVHVNLLAGTFITVIMSVMVSQITRVSIVYCLFRRRSKKTSKVSVTGLCAGNSPGTGEFPAQRASNAENVSIWWHHHVDSLAMHEYLRNNLHYYLKFHTFFLKINRLANVICKLHWFFFTANGLTRCLNKMFAISWTAFGNWFSMKIYSY